MRFNKNIEMVKIVSEKEPLQKEQYYALMVTDSPKNDDVRHFFNKQKGWIGFERTSDKQIYISKKFSCRRLAIRGDTWIVSVANPVLCCELTY